jgi:hypothetical protein
MTKRTGFVAVIAVVASISADSARADNFITAGYLGLKARFGQIMNATVGEEGTKCMGQQMSGAFYDTITLYTQYKKTAEAERKACEEFEKQQATRAQNKKLKAPAGPGNQQQVATPDPTLQGS